MAFPNMSRDITIPGAILSFVFMLYFLWPEIQAFHNHRRHRMLALFGMVISGAVFLCCATWYFWPEKSSAIGEQKPNSTANTQTMDESNRHATSSAPDVTLRFVFSESPALQILNISDKLAREIRWTLVLWNLDDPKVYSNPNGPDMADKHEPLPLPSSTMDFIRPRSDGPPLNIFRSPFVAPHVKTGDRLIGSASVICPDCERGHTLIVYIVLGKGGWYSEVKDNKNGDVIIPKRLTKQHVIDYYNTLTLTIPEKDRVPIGDLF